MCLYLPATNGSLIEQVAVEERSDTHYHQDPARDRDEHVRFVISPLKD